MNVYLASPNNQLQASWLADMPVLLSYASWDSWIQRYTMSFSRILIDSGAFSELNSGKKIDIERYRRFCLQYQFLADAMAGLDDINGDWRRSLKNYQTLDMGFPTIHDTDPPELLNELIEMAREPKRRGWLGIGLKPPREGKERFIRDVCERVPDDIHLHGWALRRYTHISRLDSVDSTNWFRDAMKTRTMLPWLTLSETIEIIIKRYKRETRIIIDDNQENLKLGFKEE